MNKTRFALILIVILSVFAATIPALADTPCDPSVNYSRLGQTQYDAGDFQLAIESFTCAATLRPDLASAFNARGNAYRSLGNFEQAIVDYDKAIEIDKEYAIAYNNRGWAYFNLKDEDHALEDYNKALEIDPNLSYAYNNRGLIYQFNLQNDLANADFNRAIELNMPTPWATYNLRLMELQPAVTGVNVTPAAPGVQALVDQAFSAYWAREFSTAANFFSQALEIDPDHFESHYYRGRSYNALDMFPEALADFERMVDLRPDFAYGYWERSVAYAEMGDFERARADAKRAYELDPEHVNNFISQGSIAALAGDPVEAGRQFNLLLQAYGTQPISGDAINPDEPVTLQMDPKVIYAISFEGKAGQVLMIEAHSTEADPVIVLLDVNDVPVNGDDDSGTSLDSLIRDYELAEDGTYTILLSHAGGGNTGLINVTLEFSLSE